MDFQIDLNPAHHILRLTLISAVVDLKCAEEAYIRLKYIASRGGPHAAIYDLSAVTGTTLTLKEIRKYARRNPSIPGRTPHVVVGKDPNIYGLARIFQMCREAHKGQHFDVVRTLQEAYDLVGAHPEEFTKHLFPEATKLGETPHREE